MVLGLIAAVVLAKGSVIKAIAMIVLGLLLGMVGTDSHHRRVRASPSTSRELADGIDFVAVAMGMFGIAEIIRNLEHAAERRERDQRRSTGLCRRARTSGAIVGPILRGTILGSVLGILPGGGAVLASFAAYTLEKKISKTPEAVRQGRDRGRRGARSRPTTPPRRPRSSRC